MKKVYTLLAALIALTACTPKHNLIVNYKGLSNDTIFYSFSQLSDFLESPGMFEIDTAILKGGKFKMDVEVTDEPVFFCIYSMDYRHQEQNGRRWLRPSGEILNILYPNEPLHIDAVSADGYISTTVKKGNQVNHDISAVKSEFRRYQHEYEDVLWGTYEGEMEPRVRDAKKLELKELLSTTHSNFIEGHPANKASAFFLVYLKDMAEYADKLDESIFEGEFAPIKEQMDRAVVVEKAKKVFSYDESGFTMKTLAAEEVTKDNLKGKITLLYFWGTHQGGWLNGVPKLMELKGKYGDKFEVVIINCREANDALWSKTLKLKGLDWGKYFSKYAGNSYPTKVILSEQGEKLGVFVNQTPDYNHSFVYEFEELMRSI